MRHIFWCNFQPKQTKRISGCAPQFLIIESVGAGHFSCLSGKDENIFLKVRLSYFFIRLDYRHVARYQKKNKTRSCFSEKYVIDERRTNKLTDITRMRRSGILLWGIKNIGIHDFLYCLYIYFHPSAYIYFHPSPPNKKTNKHSR